MCNHNNVFTKSAQKLYVTVLEITVYMYILFTGIFVILHGLELEMLTSVIMMLADTCIFLLMEEFHLAVGGCVYIETPARKMALSHTYI